MAPSRWWTNSTLAVVTGGNKGIGFEIVRQLAKKGVSVILTSRDVNRGLAAQQKLASENLNVQFHQLDVTSEESVIALASWLKAEHEGFDILVNNAAVVGRDSEYQAVKHVMNTNYYGVKRTTKHLIPLLKPSEAGARIVNISSQLGQLRRLKNDSHKRPLADVDSLSEQLIDSFVENYVSEVEAGKTVGKGIYDSYTVSKAALNAYTRLVAKQLEASEKKIYVNCVHPGYVRTDLNNNNGVLPAEDGADTAVWLALLPPGGSTGEFYFERKLYEF